VNDFPALGHVGGAELVYTRTAKDGSSEKTKVIFAPTPAI
jgi:hypothetical protein